MTIEYTTYVTHIDHAMAYVDEAARWLSAAPGTVDDRSIAYLIALYTAELCAGRVSHHITQELIGYGVDVGDIHTAARAISGLMLRVAAYSKR